jgi:hypothetical protein
MLPTSPEAIDFACICRHGTESIDYLCAIWTSGL